APWWGGGARRSTGRGRGVFLAGARPGGGPAGRGAPPPRPGHGVGPPRREPPAFAAATLTANCVVCVSHDSAQLTAAEGIAGRRIKMIWNGIDIERFHQSECEKSGPVIAVGRLSPEKDFATLIRAATIAAREDPTFRLEVAGSGGCAEELQRIIHEHQLENQIWLLGQVSHIPALLARG